MFHRLSLKTRVTSKGLISLDTLKKLCIKNVPSVAIPNTFGPAICFSFHNNQKKGKKQLDTRKQTRWRVREDSKLKKL